MKITAKKLRKLKACKEQVEIFEKEWPQGCRVTLKACRRAVELGLDLNWAVGHILSAPARAAYMEAEAPAWAVYEEATAPAFYRAAKSDGEGE